MKTINLRAGWKITIPKKQRKDYPTEQDFLFVAASLALEAYVKSGADSLDGAVCSLMETLEGDPDIPREPLFLRKIRSEA